MTADGQIPESRLEPHQISLIIPKPGRIVNVAVIRVPEFRSAANGAIAEAAAEGTDGLLEDVGLGGFAET